MVEAPHAPSQPEKTHLTAVVLIPPESLWEPIQAIRRRYDRNVLRWMPHVTLLYPFRPRDRFEAAIAEFGRACGDLDPFPLTLARLRAFDHGDGSFTMWLAPEPAESVVRLHETLWRAAPECDDVRLFRNGFTPHLSVGQVHGREALLAVHREFQGTWRPLAFTANGVSLIWRDAPPEDIFRVDSVVPIGRPR